MDIRSLSYQRSPPKVEKGSKISALARIVEECRTLLDTLTIFDFFALHQMCRNMSKFVLILFEDFAMFFDVALFAGPFVVR